MFAGFLYDDAGDPVVGATANLYDRNTTTPVRATTTTDASGYWAISHATEGRFDVELVNGSSKRRIKYDDSVQLETVEVAVLRMRNPADTFDYDLVPAAITADRQLNLPLITGTDTLSALGLAQTYSAVKTFSAIPVMSGGAVGFPATQVASAGANDLDDYEEGTFTPGLTFGGAAVGMTFAATRNGTYTKIGDRVHVSIRFVLTAKGSSVGAAVVTGLPFTAGSGAADYVPASFVLATVSFADWPCGYVNQSDTTIALEEKTNAGVGTNLADTDFADTSTVIISLSYKV